MPTIIHSREVPLASTALHAALGDVLENIAAQSRLDAIALRANIGASGTVSVPVEITVTKRSPKDWSIALTIRARSATPFFPAFKGTFHTLAMTPSRTNLRLRGTYQVPLGAVGVAINGAGLHKVAEDSLYQLFDRVVDESIAAIRDDAIARIRASRA